MSSGIWSRDIANSPQGDFRGRKLGGNYTLLPIFDQWPEFLSDQIQPEARDQANLLI